MTAGSALTHDVADDVLPDPPPLLLRGLFVASGDALCNGGHFSLLESSPN